MDTSSTFVTAFTYKTRSVATPVDLWRSGIKAPFGKQVVNAEGIITLSVSLFTFIFWDKIYTAKGTIFFIYAF